MQASPRAAATLMHGISILCACQRRRVRARGLQLPAVGRVPRPGVRPLRCRFAVWGHAAYKVRPGERWILTLSVLLSGLGVVAACAQNLLPNPGLEEGAEQPLGWRLAEGKGTYHQGREEGHDSQRWLTVRGNGDDQSYWRTEPMPFTPGGLYRLQFHGRRGPDGGGGTAVAGHDRVSRDFPLTDRWQSYRFLFAVPQDSERDFIRLGQWHVKGDIHFDDLELTPVLATHARLASGLELGEGESLRQGVYRFEPNLDWLGANYHRPLATNRARFNSNRWLFHPGAAVVYRHRLQGNPQSAAKVRVGINHYEAGTLRVEASPDGRAWTRLGELGGAQRTGRFELPATLFPADEVWVRLAHAGDGNGFQVDTYRYEATLAHRLPDAEGETWFSQVLASDANLAVTWEQIQPADSQGLCRVELGLSNRTANALTLRASLWREPGLASGNLASSSQPKSDRGTAPTNTGTLEGADAGQAQDVRLEGGHATTASLACQLDEPGEHPLRVAVRDRAGHTLFLSETSVRLGFLSDRRFGYWLPGKTDLGLWWCESGWKVGRERGLPAPPKSGAVRPLSLAAARGEYEAAQVVLRPTREGVLLSAQVSPLRNPQGAPGPITARVDEVAYVPVTRPTDSASLRGSYPDPLPPLRAPLPLQANRNQPLWITFQVGRDTRAGDYTGQLELQTSLGGISVPIQVRVYDFALPEDTHLRSALGLGSGEINRYHRLSDPRQKEAVFEQYLANFAAHRISPYSFYDYANMEVRFAGEGTNKQARLDCSRFDVAAAKWLDEHRFNTFQLPLRGMGGGTFHERYLGDLEGFKEGTPEHARLFQDYLSQVEAHLRQRGWLARAFTYWFDEPDPKDYEFVVAGMKRLKDAAPGVKRMLTEQPESALLGHVDIWCGLTPEWTPEKVKARRAAGEEVWWYICTGPKAPFVTEFIDHPGTELRLWPWQSWQYGVTGILIWATIYWTSPLAYPEPNLQDPWADPMSWVSGYGLPVGHISPWGNGDGRFLYPPRRDPQAAREPNLDEPINSSRWENLRDGMEDYEYLWLLQQAVERVQAAQPQADLLEPARALLIVPREVSADLTHFTTDPRPLLEHRERVARMIERLNGAK